MAKPFRLFRTSLTAMLLTLAAATPAAPAAAPASRLTVVELFTSQGCSSCPPANAALASLAGRADILALSFGVTYWDHLGWKDTFASQANTQRQRDYSRGLKHDNVWTPQVVVDGRFDTPGQRASKIEPLIKAAKARRLDGPQVALQPDRVLVGQGAAGGEASVWLVRYDPRIVHVPVKAGENGGRTLPHRNVVRQLVMLGAWNGAARSYMLKASPDPAFKTAILVQAGVGGPIIAAAKG